MVHTRTLLAFHSVTDRKFLPTNGVEWYQASETAPKTFVLKNLNDEQDLQSQKPLTEYHITIASTVAFKELHKKIPHILSNRTTINLVTLTIDINTETEAFDLTGFISYFPTLREVTFHSNRFISIQALLKHPGLKKINILNGLMFLAPQEKESILETKLHARKAIVLDRFAYQFYHPPSLFFWCSIFLLALCFDIGSRLLSIAHAESHEPGSNPRNQTLVFNSKTAIPLVMLATTTLFTIALTLFGIQRVHAQNREIIKQPSEQKQIQDASQT